MLSLKKQKQNDMKTFIELSKEGYEGSFTVEPNELTEIHVNWEKQSLTIEVYENKNKLLGGFTRETKYAGLVFFGGKSLEQLYNEVMQNF